MLEGGGYALVVPLGRALAGFVFGIILGILGGWFAVIFNAMIEYSWPLAVHRTIYLVGIGLGAGTGAYLAWINLNLRWYLIMGSVLLALVAGVVGVYVGYAYGQYVDSNFLGRQYAIENAIHFGAAIGGIAVTTILGLISQRRTFGR